MNGKANHILVAYQLVIFLLQQQFSILVLSHKKTFDILNCSTISRQSYFRHQRDFLQLAVHNVWDQLQQSLLAQFRMNERGLILSGDGRADSPGHSAKFGTYTVIELTCNKVIDFKLV